MRRGLELKRNSSKTLNSISIKTIILIVFIVSVMATAAGTGFLIYTRWEQSNNTVIKRFAEDINGDILDHIENCLHTPEHIIEVNMGLLELGIVNVDDKDDLEKFFLNIIRSHDANIYSVTYATEDGEYYGIRRLADNSFDFVRNNAETEGHSLYYAINNDGTLGEFSHDAGYFDPRMRDWYQEAVRANGFTYSPVYEHFVMDDLTITAAIPIKGDDDQIKGVLGVHLLLGELSNGFLEIADEHKGAYALVVERQTGDLIANSLGDDNFTIDSDGRFERINLSETENRVAYSTYEEYKKGNLRFVEDYRGDEKLFSKAVVFKRPGIDWLIISAVSEDIIGGTLKDTTKESIRIAIAILASSMVIFLLISRRLLSPVEDILSANRKFADGDMGARVEIKRRDEIGRIAESYNFMADILEETILSLEEQVNSRTSDLTAANEELRENKDRLQMILNSAGEGIYGLDSMAKCTFINRSALEMLGYEDYDELLGKNMHNLIHHSYKNGYPMPVEDCNIYKSMTTGEGKHIDDEVFWRKDNTSFEAEYFSYPQVIDGNVVGGVVTFWDISNRKSLERQMYTDKEKFRTTLFSVGDGVISTDHRGRIEFINPVAEKLTGWSIDEARGNPFDLIFNIVNEFSNSKCENPVERVLETAEIIELASNTILISKDGRRIPVEDSAAPIKNSDGYVTGVVVVFRDFTEKREKIREIEYLSFNDYLTGLYNRRYMEDSVKRIDSQRNLPFTIIVIDVNGLKLTNDAFGHKMGDRLLIEVADMLSNTCREDDIVGRMGGDEFMILLPRTDETQALKIKKRIEKAAREIKLESVVVSLAVGYSTKTNPETDIKLIMTQADNQMYKDKLKYGKLMRSRTIETVLKNINLKYDNEQIHTERVSQYSVAIAKEMGYSEAEVENIKTAAILHDIGKIMIPPEILSKPTRLTEEEFSIIKKHPETSYQILKSVDEYSTLANYVLYHHERIDGKGYPEGLKGDEIPVISRIISVADAYEAMTATRPYQKQKSKDEAITELVKNSGTQFDSEIVKVFVEKVL